MADSTCQLGCHRASMFPQVSGHRPGLILPVPRAQAFRLALGCPLVSLLPQLEDGRPQDSTISLTT